VAASIFASKEKKEKKEKKRKKRKEKKRKEKKRKKTSRTSFPSPNTLFVALLVRMESSDSAW